MTVLLFDDAAQVTIEVSRTTSRQSKAILDAYSRAVPVTYDDIMRLVGRGSSGPRTLDGHNHVPCP